MAVSAPDRRPAIPTPGWHDRATRPGSPPLRQPVAEVDCVPGGTRPGRSGTAGGTAGCSTGPIPPGAGGTLRVPVVGRSHPRAVPRRLGPLRRCGRSGMNVLTFPAHGSGPCRAVGATGWRIRYRRSLVSGAANTYLSPSNRRREANRVWTRPQRDPRQSTVEENGHKPELAQPAPSPTSRRSGAARRGDTAQVRRHPRPDPC
jgi:hypothetical protein